MIESSLLQRIYAVIELENVIGVSSTTFSKNIDLIFFFKIANISDRELIKKHDMNIQISQKRAYRPYFFFFCNENNRKYTIIKRRTV